MYQAWQWPTAVNATDTSTVQQSTVATVGAVSAPSVTPQWPTQTVAYGQYAVPATMQQPWGAWQYAYPGNMAVGQVRPQYPQVPLAGAYPSTAQTYQAPQAFQNANTVWPSEGFQAVQSATEVSAESKVEQPTQASQPSEQNSTVAPKVEETGSVSDQPKQEVDDLADLDKEAEEFERQFIEWEKQFENWKQQNISHPDREAFAEYEKQWQEWRNQLLQRREDMQRARAERKKHSLSDHDKQPAVEGKLPSDGQSPASVSQLTPPNVQGFNTTTTTTAASSVSQLGTAPNQMIPGLDHIRGEQTVTSHSGNMPPVSQGSTQGAASNQNLYYSSQLALGNPQQNLMFMPPPQQFPFPSGPPPHTQAPPLHGLAPPHNQALPLQTQMLPPHNQAAPAVSQFQVPRHPPPPPPGNTQNDIDAAKSFMSGADGFKTQEQKRPLLSTPPQPGGQGSGSRGLPAQGGPGGLLPLPHLESRFGPPQNRDFGGPGNQDDMINESNQEFPSPRGLNLRHEFDQLQDMPKEEERDYFMMGGDGKNDPRGFGNQEPFMDQREMDQNKFQDGWGFGSDRGRGRGRGFEREMRQRGRGRGRGRESRWNDDNDPRSFEPPSDNMQFPGDCASRNREFGDNAGPPRDFSERRSTRWGPPSKQLHDVGDMEPQSNLEFKGNDIHPPGFGQKHGEQFDKGLSRDEESFLDKTGRNVDPFNDEFKGRPRGDDRRPLKGDEQSGRSRDERSPFRDFVGRPRGEDRGPFGRDDFMGMPPGDDKGLFKGDEFMGRPPPEDRGSFKGEEFLGRPPGSDRSGFKGEEFTGKLPVDDRGPFKGEEFMGRPRGDNRTLLKEEFPPGPFKGRGFPSGGGPEEPFPGALVEKKRVPEALHGSDRFQESFMDDQMPPFAAFESERFSQGPLDKNERYPGHFREAERYSLREDPDEMFPPGRHPDPFLSKVGERERFPGRPGPLLGRDRFPPGPERERMSIMGPGPGMEPFDDEKFPPRLPFERNFPRQPPFEDERFIRDECFPFREPDPERFMGSERFSHGRFRNSRFGPKNFPHDELMGRPGILPGPDSPFVGPDGPFNIPDAPFPIPDAPYPISDAPFPGMEHPFPLEEYHRRNFPFDEDPHFRMNFPDERFPGPFPFDREKGPFNEPPFGGPGRRPPFDRGNDERFNMHFNSIDYTHNSALSVLGEEFVQKFDAFDQPYGADLMSYRAVFDYAHRRGESPHSRERIFSRDRESDKSRDPERSRERDRDRDRERDRNRDRDRNRERERNRDRDRGKERDSDKDRDRDRKDKRERDRNVHGEERSRDGKRDRDHDRDRERTKDREDGENKRSRWEHQAEGDRNFSKDRSSDSASQRQNGERDSEVGADNLESRNSSQLGTQPDLFKTDSKTETVLIKDLLYPPGRFTRPKQLVIILRGLPGSGKTYVAKLIKDKEVENGGSAPRILSLDDYFMMEKEVTDADPDTGKRLKRREFQFEYEKDMEEAYRSSLYKSFKKTIDDRFFPFIIVDAIHDKVKQFEQYWSYAKQRGFQVYIAEMDCKDPVICHKRNVHNRNQADITEILNKWEQKPSHFMDVDVRALLQDVSITEVEMEDLHSEEKNDNESSKAEDADDTDDFTRFHVPSRWEKLENTEEKLDKLDGLLGSKKKHSSIEDYLQLPDDYEERPCEPGKKRVRWADLEERKEQDRLRAIGFVVGQTDWTKMTDPSHAERALTRTKYI